MSFITSIGTATPPHALIQSRIADFMVRAMAMGEDDARKLRVLFRASGIDTRYSVIEDYGKTEGFSFYENSKNMEPFPTTKRRLELYRRHALAVSVEAALGCLSSAAELRKDSITHLIVVSCTGMYAPGLDIDLVKALGLNTNIERTSINFMGCYAAFNALKLADAACSANPASKVLIVCTELCTIHFQKENSEDNVLANALFSDGAAAVLVESTSRSGLSLEMESFHCELATEGEHDMTWTVGNVGFEMRLSSYVPEFVRGGIKSLTRSLLGKIHRSLPEVAYFAIHPGGKKILEAIERELGLTKEHNKYAYEVLRKFGNMSSATVLFVLKELSRDLTIADNGKRILSCAFGPGLTLESMLLKVEHSPV
ncbi:MAG TPA: type III polyketide synthase [Cyclobacteriaceae bacterium]|nr:type III polyketide synthase [Cyclobacteriaceae bacterium]